MGSRYIYIYIYITNIWYILFNLVYIIYIYIRRPLAQARGGGEREGQSQSLTLRKSGSESSRKSNQSALGPSNQGQMLHSMVWLHAQRCCPGLHKGQSFQPHLPPLLLDAFTGFEGAQMAAALQTTWPPVGPESCWGSAVSHACPRRGPCL